MARPIDKAIANLKKQLDGITDAKERAAVVKALRELSRAVNKELGKIRLGGREGGMGPVWARVPEWV